MDIQRRHDSLWVNREDVPTKDEMRSLASRRLLEIFDKLPHERDRFAFLIGAVHPYVWLTANSRGNAFIDMAYDFIGNFYGVSGDNLRASVSSREGALYDLETHPGCGKADALDVAMIILRNYVISIGMIFSDDGSSVVNKFIRSMHDAWFEAAQVWRA